MSSVSIVYCQYTTQFTGVQLIEGNPEYLCFRALHGERRWMTLLSIPPNPFSSRQRRFKALASHLFTSSGIRSTPRTIPSAPPRLRL
jgi:hypothetical protein